MNITRNLPLSALLIQHATAALLAADGVVAAQRELGAAVAADVVDGGALGWVDDRPRVVGAGARAAAHRRAAAAAADGDLVRLAGHDRAGWMFGDR